MKNGVVRCVAFACGLLLGGLVLLGCSGDDKSPLQEHSFQADDASSYTITLHEDSMLLKRNGVKVDSAVLLVFLSSDCQACQGYYEHLNHLQANEEKLVILGVLEDEPQAESKDMPKEQALSSTKEQLGIAFTLLQDSSKTPLLQNLLAKKHARIEALLATQSPAQPLESSSQEPQSQAPKQALAEEAAPQEAQLDSSTPPYALPYFVLYDTEQRFYQDYEGIVPEEIFSSDIAQITH